MENYSPSDITHKAYQVMLWRAFDIAGASLLLLFVLPLIGLIALAILIDDGNPVLFSHRRIGRDGHYFPCFKFRTMKVHTTASFLSYLQSRPEMLKEWTETLKLRKDPRITRVGRLLRKTSLDELPQLFNVLRGEMSLVGPRPIVDEEIARYGSYFPTYCKVRPGLTGLWQVSGRSDTTYTERVALDCEYINKKSIIFDTMLIVRTVPAVVVSKGAY